MQSNKSELFRNRVATHTERSAEDQAAVSTLQNFLKSGGKINPNFAANDKWPNTDGCFEFVSNPDLSRCPDQNFVVQIKGTRNYTETNGIISYSLKSLGFPAYIACEVTADPGILFVVLNPERRGEERVFWKYMSPGYINSIDFNNKSTTIKFSPEEEIEYTEESVNRFCKKLERIMDVHLFLRKLNRDNLKKEDALKIVEVRCEDISLEIERIKSGNKSRDNISRRILTRLYDLCYAAIVLNAISLGYTDVNEKLAWELAQFNIETKYLSNFLKGLKYIGSRIPDDGQSERLMLKYYNYLWEIRRFLDCKFNIKVLENLEDFPLCMDTLDTEYYETVASSIAAKDLTPGLLKKTRYYIQKKTPFFVNGERYFEITLQLAGMYATKFNRITVYTKQNVSTKYSIQIAYTNAEIDLWGVKNEIKVVTNWKVSIAPPCLNKLGKILYIHMELSANYGEYGSLMNWLTRTGMNLLDLINLQKFRFNSVISEIYDGKNTNMFREVLIKLRKDYSVASSKKGKHTVRYVLLNLREEVLEAVLPNAFDTKELTDDLYITSRCYPFENNPFVSNLAGRKTSKGSIEDILEITSNPKKLDIVRPYLAIEHLVRETGELYFDVASVATMEEIKKYNDSLDDWERRNGFLIKEDGGTVTIDSYEYMTLYILEKLLNMSHTANRGQRETNLRYLKQCNINFEDSLKKIALQKLFVNSQVMLIYGAAGTGKTTLMNYISNMLGQSRKLFLTKTYTALQNLERRIENPGPESNFISFDRFTKKVTLENFDVIFVDECSTIDNRTMKQFLEKIGENTLLVLAGDIHQIEAIDFGNWFYYAKDIIETDGANIELLSTWRTDKEELKSLWDSVRNREPIITEKLAMDGPFSSDIGKDIFETAEDEIILCLNYDGKFGLNNMNLYFQNANENEAFSWEEWTFKVGDPIIFLDNNRSDLLYNNLKGRIVGIEKKETSIVFILDIDTVLTERQCSYEDFDFVDVTEKSTRIRLEVITIDDETATEAERIKTIVPFQIAYAASIHKAQGLEYKSVKIVIPSYNADKISHSIFYTAITRATERLKIYWSAETMEKIVGGFAQESEEQRTLLLIKEKLGLR